ncbi:MAG TPA: hypothetical protein VHV26_01555 [Rhizomicrobium sp.]|jgi:hypothetical protein|nr:hypothetical protein [Rhizomicrobium sp.]
MTAFRRYSRDTPTRQFHELVDLYKQMHAAGYVAQRGEESVAIAAASAFPGDALPMWSAFIREEILRYGSHSLLDYGAGKARYYKQPQQFIQHGGTVHTGMLRPYWNNIEIHTYEPALGDVLPDRKFDCVVNADVLEHVFAGDIPWVVNEMFSLASHFVFCNIACYPAQARLPTGEDAHIMVRTPDYWHGVFDIVANNHPGVDYVLACSMGWGLDKSLIYRRIPFETLHQGNKYAVA